HFLPVLQGKSVTAKRLLTLLTVTAVGTTGLWASPALATSTQPAAEHTAAVVREATAGMLNPVRGANSSERAFDTTVADNHISVDAAPGSPVVVDTASGVQFRLHLPEPGSVRATQASD